MKPIAVFRSSDLAVRKVVYNVPRISLKDMRKLWF
jgi:hypothetical protein